MTQNSQGKVPKDLIFSMENRNVLLGPLGGMVDTVDLKSADP